MSTHPFLTAVPPVVEVPPPFVPPPLTVGQKLSFYAWWLLIVALLLAWWAALLWLASIGYGLLLCVVLVAELLVLGWVLYDTNKRP